MSTSMSQAVAAEYATRQNARFSLLLRINAATFMDSGCDISFLSGNGRPKREPAPPTDRTENSRASARATFMILV